jgi:hypothetical protein
MEIRKRRKIHAEAVAADERRALVYKFIAVLREDPWFNVLSPERVGFNVSEYYNRVCWLLYGEYRPLIEYRDERWVCSGAYEKFGFGDEPREALIRWYISMRAGKETVSEIHAKEKEREEASEGAGERRRRRKAGEVSGGVEDGERRHRRSRTA